MFIPIWNETVNKVLNGAIVQDFQESLGVIIGFAIVIVIILFSVKSFVNFFIDDVMNNKSKEYIQFARALEDWKHDIRN